jgi:succinate dehydrogenase/fumarate reductase flavoprotein subunit
MLIGRGIEIDEYGATNVAGLYAAGDEVGNFRADIAGAAVIGRFAGESAAAYALNTEFSQKESDIAKHPSVAKKADEYTKLLENDGQAHWEEFNQGIQQILNDYAGIDFVRSESLLKTGLTYLEQLERNSKKNLKVLDSHELMRTVECFDLLLVGKLICLTALERKESRGMHKRSDFTFTNPLLNKKMLSIRKENNHAVLEWRSIR